MHKSKFWWVVLCLMIGIDFYFFQTIVFVAASASVTVQTIIYVVYWTISVGAIVTLFILPYLHFEKQAKMGGTKIFAIVTGTFFAKLIGSVFFLLDDIRRLLWWAVGSHEAHISRSMILSWLGIISGCALLAALIKGFGNKYRYQVKKVKLNYENLPAAFRGLKAVHISDIHSGSFTDKDAVRKGVEKIMEEKPDVILFTGDLVNNIADEMKEYMDVFDKLSAPLGVFSTLGNHDYGDYVRWPSVEHKEANLDKLKKVHHELGWRLLMNEHVVLQKEEDRIAILGIENWSAKARFPMYGDLKKAHSGTEHYPFKILLSHDPSHWKAEVCELFCDIDLTLAGHTHGMQFGFEVPWLKWSPVRFVYKEWAGLYESKAAEGGKGAQRLYINRGFGFLGYPGRVGIMPEITVLEFS